VEKQVLYDNTHVPLNAPKQCDERHINVNTRACWLSMI